MAGPGKKRISSGEEKDRGVCRECTTWVVAVGLRGNRYLKTLWSNYGGCFLAETGLSRNRQNKDRLKKKSCYTYFQDIIGGSVRLASA